MMISQISEIRRCKQFIYLFNHLLIQQRTLQIFFDISCRIPVSAVPYIIFKFKKKSMIIIRLPILDKVSRFSSERSITGSPQGVTTGSKAVTHKILMYAFNWPQPQPQHNRGIFSISGRRPESVDLWLVLYSKIRGESMSLTLWRRWESKYICEWWKLMLRPANNYHLFIIIFLPYHCHYHWHCVVKNNVIIGYGTISTI